MRQPPAGVDPRSLSELLRTNRLGQPIGAALNDWKVPVALSTDLLVGNHVRLERVRPDHAAGLHAVFSEDHEGYGWTYLPYGPFATEAELLAWVIPFTRSDDPRMYALVDTDNNTVGGVASYLRINPASGSAEVGHIHFSNRLKKTRAATEAMFLMAEHVFKLGYRRYEWKCDALNEGSRRAAMRFGFNFEGIFRQATVYKNRNRDTAWFAMLDSQWPALRDAYRVWLADENFDDAGRQKKSLADVMACPSV